MNRSLTFAFIVFLGFKIAHFALANRLIIIPIDDTK